LLELTDVAVRLGEREVLDGVSLAVGAGEVVGLVGRNGAGKTTVVRAASGIVSARRGAVRVAGRELAAWSRRELARRVAVVPQHGSVPFPFRVMELVLMGRTPHLGLLRFEGRDDVERARAAMERLGISALAERSVLELSGGTAFLDLEHRLAVLAVVRELAARGRGALLVSHDLGLAARFCDRIAILAGGRVLADGPPTRVLSPELLREGFGIDAELLTASDGSPVVVPRTAAPRPDRA
jgi:iron complex transport system ATP-binding protein